MKPLIAWQVVDGKAGHINQSRGLVEALARRLPVEGHLINVQTQPLWRAFGTGRWSHERSLPDPDLIIGAGHRTHYWLLGARYWRGSRTVVLMQPSLPSRWFDLRIISRHDEPKPDGNVLPIRGVLNAARFHPDHDAARGLFLIGGPCRHAWWEDEPLVKQVIRLAEAQPDVRWSLTTSRRTPGEFLERVRTRHPANLEVLAFDETDRNWVPEQLARAAQVWVTPDSVSMVFEALTSGAAVGLLDLELKRGTKLGAELRRLDGDGWLTTFADHNPKDMLTAPPERLDEAGRCADWIVEHWFKGR